MFQDLKEQEDDVRHPHVGGHRHHQSKAKLSAQGTDKKLSAQEQQNKVFDEKMYKRALEEAKLEQKMRSLIRNQKL
jgi:hypothetical protein